MEAVKTNIIGAENLLNKSIKANVKKVRRLGVDNSVIAGFAGSTADAFALFERLESNNDLWKKKIENREISSLEFEKLHSMYRNVVAEFQIPLAVVKSKESDKKHRYEYRLSSPDGTGKPVDTPLNIVRY